MRQPVATDTVQACSAYEGSHRLVLALEESVKMADRDVVRGSDGARRQVGVMQVMSDDRPDAQRDPPSPLITTQTDATRATVGSTRTYPGADTTTDVAVSRDRLPVTNSQMYTYLVLAGGGDGLLIGERVIVDLVAAPGPRADQPSRWSGVRRWVTAGRG
ncbi:hypothetical protein [Streptomyces sp. 5-10]|uniref:hypothetical protein n=1 Tax=Streptomyces sp. 5-10 TaxID=878925 RepID=UPI00168B9F05|nr:hypothetical protein [Streptomyces sp. 5-10]MBD3005396.1 hypothetical protein [Streptomyces sp. 5-10]